MVKRRSVNRRQSSIHIVPGVFFAVIQLYWILLNAAK